MRVPCDKAPSIGYLASFLEPRDSPPQVDDLGPIDRFIFGGTVGASMIALARAEKEGRAGERDLAAAVAEVGKLAAAAAAVEKLWDVDADDGDGDDPTVSDF
eukprot:3114987-Pyramimonas_sp.AAC.1